MAEPARRLPKEDEPDIRPDFLPDLERRAGMRSIEGGSQGDGVPRGDLHSVPSGSELAEQEAADGEGATPTKDLREAAQDGSLDSPGWYNRAKDQKTRLGGTLNSRLGKFAKSKWAIGIGLGAGSFLIFIAFLFFFLGALKIPHFMEHITAYQFTRTTRQMTQNANNITEEKMAIDSSNPTLRQQMKSWFNDRTTVRKTKDLWSKFDKYRPNKIIDNFNTKNVMSLTYDSSGILRGVTIGNKTFLMDSPTGFSRFVPGAKFRAQVNFAADIAPSIETALKSDDVAPVVRGTVAREIRQRLGIGLVAWKIGDYRGKSVGEANLQEARDMVKAINDENVQASKTKTLDEATNNAKEQLEKDLANDKTLTEIVDNGGIDKQAVDIIEKTASGDGMVKAIAGALSPTYNIAMPVCLVYDGSSIKQNGGTINSMTNAQIKAALYGASAASQTVNGYDVPAEAEGAYGARLGDNISTFPSEERASGGRVNTTQYASTEATPAGDFSYTAFDAAFGSFAGPANTIAESLCPTLTDPALAIALGLGNILACLNPIGGTESCVGEKAASEGAKTLLGRIADKVVTRVATEDTGAKASAIGGYLQNGIKDLVKTGAKIAGATLITRAVVLERMGAAHNGTQSNTDLGVDTDSGMNLYAQQVNQQEFAGRPLTDAEINQSEQADQKFRAQEAAAQPAFQRYASLNNPDSLITRFGTLAMAHFNTSAINSLIHLGSSLLNPLRSIANMFLGFNSKVAMAAEPYTSANTYYGNVQFGWSEDETKLLQTDPSYMPLENQEILDENYSIDSNGNKTYREDQIAAKYTKCFDGSEQIGDMLAGGDIQRDENGNVLADQGLCSPDNLSYNNASDGQDISPATKHPNDLVFRWRLAQSYNNSLDQLENAQDVTN
jgi:hypothetical protein